MTTTTPMNDQASGIKPGPGAGDDADTRFGHGNESGRAAGPHRRHWATGMLGAAVLLAVGAAVGCNDLYPALPVPPEAYVSKPGNTLTPGDEIRVVFSVAPELNTQQKIQPTGKISLPTIGEVTAAGRSVTSLQQQLTTLYQPHLQDSTVTVSLAATAAGVYVSGAVLRPGKLPLDRPLTVLEAVMEAGGFSPMANPRQVVVVRTQDGKSKNYVLNLHQALNGTESTPFYVRPYDVIYVKESAW
ncbi:MAG: polysaccharide export protein [Verrucomicrobia bacterium]|nr:polysaccharide export protein [Verrucomicrobiota bacterium]